MNKETPSNHSEILSNVLPPSVHIDLLAKSRISLLLRQHEKGFSLVPPARFILQDVKNPSRTIEEYLLTAYEGFIDEKDAYEKRKMFEFIEKSGEYVDAWVDEKKWESEQNPPYYRKRHNLGTWDIWYEIHPVGSSFTIDFTMRPVATKEEKDMLKVYRAAREFSPANMKVASTYSQNGQFLDWLRQCGWNEVSEREKKLYKILFNLSDEEGTLFFPRQSVPFSMVLVLHEKSEELQILRF